jgi:hypothetical protein
MSHVEDDGAAWRRWEPILKVAYEQNRSISVTLRNGGPVFTGKPGGSVTGMRGIGSVSVCHSDGTVVNIDPREIAAIGTKAGR